MIAIMITIIVFHCGFPELERFESVTFILPCHCLAVLTKGVSRGGTVKVFRGAGPQGCFTGRDRKGVSRGGAYISAP